MKYVGYRDMDTKTYKCQNCGAPFRGEPGSRGFRCEYCGSVNEIIKTQTRESRRTRDSENESANWSQPQPDSHVEVQLKSQSNPQPQPKAKYNLGAQTQEKISNELQNKVDVLINRANSLVETYNLDEARLVYDKALSLYPEDYRAYLGKLLIELQLNKEESLTNCGADLTYYDNYNKLLTFAPEDKKAIYEVYNDVIREKFEARENQPQDLTYKNWWFWPIAFIIIFYLIVGK
jgi:DNA-directed RNA polymerase, subunit RPC10 (contains C4-type Zn-finger)